MGGSEAIHTKWGRRREILPGGSGTEAVVWEGKDLVTRKQRGRASVLGRPASKGGRKEKQWSGNSRDPLSVASVPGLGRGTRGWILGWFLGVRLVSLLVFWSQEERVMK